MLDDETSPDNALVAAALEHPMSRYLDLAARPDVANALDMFRSEREIRKTGRLDLVTWVQYICGFGYSGPPDEAWAQLFAACRVLPMLQPDQVLLREHEIAVLLAYAKIKSDNGDTMTPAQLIKHRIKPAVLGRTVARTPGILQHIHAKFENWALGPFTDMFCSFCVSMCGPSSYLPGTDELPTSLSGIGDSIRECADAHANSLLKTWGSVVTSILDIENDTASQRAAMFEEKLQEKRRFMYQQIFIKISEYLFSVTDQRAYVPDDKGDTLQYRQNPYASPAYKDKFLFARQADSKLTSFIQRIISSGPPKRSIPSSCTVPAQITICELHKPSQYGQAGLDFLQSDDIHRDVVKVRPNDTGSCFSPSRTNVRIGSFNSDTIHAEVHGVPPSQMCRALRLHLMVGVLPSKRGSSRPRFQITEITQATWVELSREEDQCVEKEPYSEMGMEYDEHDDEDSKDHLHQWCISTGIGKSLVLGSGIHWETYDMCEGMTKHEMKVKVPEDVLRRVRMEGKMSEQTMPSVAKTEPTTVDNSNSEFRDGSCRSLDLDVEMKGGGFETFTDYCWIDCHTGARITYVAPPGMELYAATPEKKGMFENAPYWKWRAP